MDTYWSTDSVAPKERAAAWVTALSEQVFPVGATPRRSRRFHGEYRLRAWGPSAYFRVRASAQVIRRGPEQIKPGDGDWLFVSSMTHGIGYLHHAGGVAEIPRGAVSFVDGSQPFELEFPTKFAYVSAMASRRDMLSMLPGAERAHGAVVPAPAGPALGMFLGTLERSLDEGLGDEERLYDHFLGLTAAALGPVLAAHAGPVMSADAMLLGRIKAFLIGMPPAPTDVRSIAGRFGVSVRKVERLFQADGTTLRRWLRGERLARCARDLLDPRCEGRSISAIAHTHGFDDMTYFSRCFRAAYGRPPGAFRRSPSTIVSAPWT